MFLQKGLFHCFFYITESLVEKETMDLTDRIAETFDGKTVFITGGTGFIGKPLIEKFLRSTNVKRLYLLIRPKKGKQPHERIKDIFNNVVR